jgi:hypothetical protein
MSALRKSENSFFSESNRNDHGLESWIQVTLDTFHHGKDHTNFYSHKIQESHESHRWGHHTGGSKSIGFGVFIPFLAFGMLLVRHIDLSDTFQEFHENVRSDPEVEPKWLIKRGQR